MDFFASCSQSAGHNPVLRKYFGFRTAASGGRINFPIQIGGHLPGKLYNGMFIRCGQQVEIQLHIRRQAGPTVLLIGCLKIDIKPNDSYEMHQLLLLDVPDSFSFREAIAIARFLSAFL